jgi:hypothetical protein
VVKIRLNGTLRPADQCQLSQPPTSRLSQFNQADHYLREFTAAVVDRTVGVPWWRATLLRLVVGRRILFSLSEHYALIK